MHTPEDDGGEDDGGDEMPSRQKLTAAQKRERPHTSRKG